MKLYQFRPKTFIGAKNGPVFAGICGDSWPLTAAAHGWDEAKSAGNQGQVYLHPSLCHTGIRKQWQGFEMIKLKHKLYSI